jgi:hypothetical protein
MNLLFIVYNNSKKIANVFLLRAQKPLDNVLIVRYNVRMNFKYSSIGTNGG